MSEDVWIVVVIPDYFINQIIATKNSSLYIFRSLVVTVVAGVLKDSL